RSSHPIGINAVIIKDHHRRIAPNSAPDPKTAPKPSGCVFAKILHAKIPIGRGEIETEVLAIDRGVAAGNEVRGLDNDFPGGTQPGPGEVQLVRGDANSARDVGDGTTRERRWPCYRVV